jgi:hypothetical protein
MHLKVDTALYETGAQGSIGKGKSNRWFAAPPSAACWGDVSGKSINRD